jgi:predicted transcriptional regulator
MTTITINLTLAERAFLIFLSQRGGSQIMLDSAVGLEAMKRLDEGLKKKGAITIEKYGIGMHSYSLTSIGNNLVDMIKESNV